MRSFLIGSLLFLLFVSSAFAGDGVDNNYIGGNANRIGLSINGAPQKNCFFGPGNLSDYGNPAVNFIVPNGTTYTIQGAVNSLTITSLESNPRSAYYDRVTSTTLYWRVYIEGSAQQGEPAEAVYFNNSIGLSHTPLDANECYSESQGDPWTWSGNVNVLSGLTAGETYVFEFYVIHELYDVGDETDLLASNCASGGNTMTLCQRVNIQTRFLKSTYNTTDPTTCDYADVVAGQSLATRIRFGYGVAAPLSWTAFSAERLQNDVLLQWETAQEVDVSRFEIERSVNGSNWALLGAEPARNQSFATNYQYADLNAPRDALYYRLKAVDLDGSYGYSKVVVVDGLESTRLYLFPNPADDHSTLQVDEGLHVRVFNQLGQLVMDVPESNGVLRIETVDWDAGTYTVVVLAPSGAIIDSKIFLVSH